MLEQSMLRDQIQALLDAERQAQESYSQLSQELPAGEWKEKICHLARDKQRHIALIERLLEILD